MTQWVEWLMVAAAVGAAGLYLVRHWLRATRGLVRGDFDSCGECGGCQPRRPLVEMSSGSSPKTKA